jgi:hypothetical protein
MDFEQITEMSWIQRWAKCGRYNPLLRHEYCVPACTEAYPITWVGDSITLLNAAKSVACDEYDFERAVAIRDLIDVLKTQ